MVILGLGSNLGDRLENLRKALHVIKNIVEINVKQVSPVYISDALVPENAPSDWDMPYLNVALRCEVSLEPYDLLKKLKNIEWGIGRKPEARHWGPRVIDIDILAWDDLIIESETLTLPHASLQERPFALWPLADVSPLWIFPLKGENQGKTAAQIVEKWRSRFTGEAPFRTRQINQRIDSSQFVGVVNVTPDSFSDGGRFLNVEQAIKQISHLVDSGTEIIDIGAEATSPKVNPMDANSEWKRLEPIFTAIKEEKKNWIITPKISVDTRHSEVAEKALAVGVNWINDVSGLDNAAMRDIISTAKTDCVVMHHLSIPESRNNVLPRDQDPVKLVYTWAENRLRELEESGIAREKIIFDPGIGFGKMAEQSLIVLQNIDVFKSLGVRILVGHSRKTFLSLLTGLPFAERDVETMVMSNYLAQHSIDYIRVHNVEICARGLKVIKNL